MVWIREINVRGPQGPSGGIDPNDPVMLQSVQDAVDDRLAAENIARAYPETAVQYTTFDSVPMQWVWRTARSPYPETYPETYAQEWTGTLRRQGDVPVLNTSGRLPWSVLPSNVARLSDIPEPGGGSDVVAARRVVARGVPIFGARVAEAVTGADPLAVVFAGSSTTRSNPGYVGFLTSILQELYLVDSPTAPQWSTDADWVERTTAGLHGYSAGENSAKAGDYLDDVESDRIAALDPALIVHMVGSNDYTGQTDPAVYEQQLRGRLAYFDSVLTKPAQHVLVHAYAKQGFTPGQYEHGEYLGAMERIATDRGDTIVIDLSADYRAVGVPGDDSMGLIGPDGTHQTPSGYRFMAALLAAYFIN